MQYIYTEYDPPHHTRCMCLFLTLFFHFALTTEGLRRQVHCWYGTASSSTNEYSLARQLGVSFGMHTLHSARRRRSSEHTVYVYSGKQTTSLVYRNTYFWRIAVASLYPHAPQGFDEALIETGSRGWEGCFRSLSLRKQRVCIAGR